MDEKKHTEPSGAPAFSPVARLHLSPAQDANDYAGTESAPHYSEGKTEWQYMCDV